MTTVFRVFCILSAAAVLCTATSSADDGDIVLLVRGDDIGSSHAANLACIESYRLGIMRSVEVMVPCPWFREAVTLLKENPGLDVGVHLTLTSEWSNYKWGPVTRAPSLTDEFGNFLPMTSQRDDFPPGTGFLESGFDIAEVERELRAQIELAVQHIPQVSHLSTHMGTAVCTPELRELVDRLADEYDLPVSLPDNVGRFSGWTSPSTPEQKTAMMVERLESLEPGTYLFVEHPGRMLPEMEAIGHTGYEYVAMDREGVTRAFTDRRVREVIGRRGIRLVSYADLLGD